MAVITKTVAGIGSVTVTGTAPFKRGPVRGSGGGAGAFVIVDAGNVNAQLKTPASPDGGVHFASDPKGNAMADAIITAVNT